MENTHSPADTEGASKRLGGEREPGKRTGPSPEAPPAEERRRRVVVGGGTAPESRNRSNT